MPYNNKDDRKLYMREYVFTSPIVVCLACGHRYRQCYKYKHIKSKKHTTSLNFQTQFQSLKNII